MDIQSMMNAMANTLRAELDNSLEFVRRDGKIVGIWTASIPANTTEKDFLTAFCNKERARKLISDTDANAMVDRIYDRKYTKTPNAAKGGFDIMF